MKWDDARNYCQSVGADLASVRSSEINDFLTTLTQAQAWIGGYKNGSFWLWTDGSTLGYSNWAENQPDNVSGNQDRIQINFGTAAAGKWDDVEGDLYDPGLPFICQKIPGFLVLYY